MARQEQHSRFKIDGLDRETGLATTIVIAASSKSRALQEASARGVVAERVEETRENNSDSGESFMPPKESGRTLNSSRSKTKPRICSLRLTGLALIGFGLLLIASALVMDTSVYSASSLGVSDRRVHNIGLLNYQLIFVVIGSASTVAGFLLRGLAVLGERLLKPGNWDALP